MRIRHVILDRDGVLNREPPAGWITTPSEFAWEDGAPEALAHLASSGVRVSVVTNQSAIGRRVASADQVEAVHRHMREDARRRGGRIDAVLVCPHAPGDRCRCRKPEPALVLEAMERSGIPPAETLLIGDDPRDLQAGRRAGVGVALVRTGKGTAAALVEPEVPVYPSLLAAVHQAVPPAQDLRVGAGAIRGAFAEHQAVLAASLEDVPRALEEAAALLVERLRGGGRVLACGNGGSAADAEHFAAELLGRLSGERPGLPALALTGCSAVLTSLANDAGYAEVFARQVEALARPGDVLVAITTSGRSPNVVAALEAARRAGCDAVALTGRDGGAAADLATRAIRIPSGETTRVQEMHALCLHALAAAVDRALGGAPPGGVPSP